jgi:hypothetical protein
MNARERSSGREFFPQAHFNRLEPRLVQAVLRLAFALWGLPLSIRVDNGSPWGGWSDWPTALALWLIGLGIEIIWNDACCPQQNGVVERSQGTSKRWVEPGLCRSVEELQERMDESDRIQREHFPHQGDLSRMQVFPSLLHSDRPYRADREKNLWELQRVLDHLADYLVQRQVDRSGTISVLNRTQYVGKAHAGQTVWVRFDPQERQWVIADAQGAEIRVKDAPELSAENICQLRVAGKK